ncbi:hypothetical protein R4K54_01850 [Brachyspira murdochii]|uniref:hypothetical protein n=1 Tax=Brachyspira murdochii TaxID=84378 RepID=UPI00300797D4
MKQYILLNTGSNKKHIFEVYEEDGDYYTETTSLCGDINLEIGYKVKNKNNIFHSPVTIVKNSSSESVNYSALPNTETCQKCKGFCE